MSVSSGLCSLLANPGEASYHLRNISYQKLEFDKNQKLRKYWGRLQLRQVTGIRKRWNKLQSIHVPMRLNQAWVLFVAIRACCIDWCWWLGKKDKMVYNWSMVAKNWGLGVGSEQFLQTCQIYQCYSFCLKWIYFCKVYWGQKSVKEAYFLIPFNL